MEQIEHGFDFLRVSIETHLQSGAVVTVTSALATDGSAIVASGLAEAFAEAGKPTLLVSAQSQIVNELRWRRPSTGVSSGARSDGRTSLTRMTVEQLNADRRAAQGSLSATLDKMRASYAVIVVDVEPMPASTSAYELVREADAVLVAIRLGRKPNRDDHTTMKLLEACDANVLGIVPTSVASSTARRSATISIAAPDPDLRAVRAPRQAEVR